MTSTNINLNTTDSTKLADDIVKNLDGLSNEEKGEILASLTMTYVNMMNELNAQHIANLKKTLALLDGIKGEEREANDNIKIKQVRNELLQS